MKVRWTRLYGGGLSWWYLVDEAFKILKAVHERDMTPALWNEETKEEEAPR